MSYRLKYLLQMKYGDALATDKREPGEFLVYGSNGPVGHHSRRNTEVPAIIVGRKGSHGKVTWADDGGFCIDTALYVDHRSCKGDLRYACYLLQVLGLDEPSKDSAVPGLDRFEAHNKPIRPLDRETQKAIADFLDRETARIDQLIEKKQAFIKALGEREEGSTRRLLSGELSQAGARITTSTPWLQSVPDHWEIVPLRYLVKVSTGGRDTQDRTDEGLYPFYVRSMSVERIDTYSYDEEAVLTSGDGAGVGKVFHHVHGKFELHQRMYAFTCFKRLSGGYFFHFLKTFFHLQMTQWSAKSTVDSVRMPFLKSMLFAVPPRHEQEALLTRIEASLQRTEQIVDATERSINRLREFRSALITAAVTGQIDVATWGRRGQTDRRIEAIEEEMAS